MVEGTGLENRHTGDRIEGSNPSPSAVAVKKCKYFLTAGCLYQGCPLLWTLFITV